MPGKILCHEFVKANISKIIIMALVFTGISLTLTPPLPARQNNDETEVYWASRTSNKYHYPSCKWAKQIIPTKLRKFESPEKAKKAGYLPCPVCKPPLFSLAKTEKARATDVKSAPPPAPVEAAPVTTIVPVTPIAVPVSQPANTKNILFISDVNLDYEANTLLLSSFKKALRDISQFNINYSYEHLQPNRYFNNAEREATLVSFLKHKYAGRSPDLLILQGGAVVGKYLSDIFPQVPVINSGNGTEMGDVRLFLNSVAYPLAFDLTLAFQVILQTQPSIKNIYIIIGDATEEREAAAAIKQAAMNYKDKINLIYLNTRPFAETLKALKKPESNSVVLYFHVYRDTSGAAYAPEKALGELRRESLIPVYAVGEQYIGAGAAGGYVFSRRKQGKYIAGIAAMILEGKKPADLQPENVSVGEYVFDWRELKAWRIDEGRLPTGSRIEYRQSIFGDLLRWKIIVLLLIMLLGTAAIIILLRKYNHQKKTVVEAERLNLELEKKLTDQTAQLEGVIKSFSEGRKPRPAVAPGEAEASGSPALAGPTDALTGLYNRPYMEEKIHEEYACFQQNVKAFHSVMGQGDFFKNIKSFSLMIGSIDHAGDVISQYGREAGDLLIKSLSGEFKETLRGCDLIARWGDDEFLFLLPEINLDSAKAVAERIRKKVEGCEYSFGEIKLSSTMTFGVSTIRVNDTAEDLQKRVDNALFKGKNTGRNCVVSA